VGQAGSGRARLRIYGSLGRKTAGKCVPETGAMTNKRLAARFYIVEDWSLVYWPIAQVDEEQTHSQVLVVHYKTQRPG